MSKKKDKDNPYSEYDDPVITGPFKYMVIEEEYTEHPTKYLVVRCILGHEDVYYTLCECEHESIAKRLMLAIVDYDLARQHD